MGYVTELRKELPEDEQLYAVKQFLTDDLESTGYIKAIVTKSINGLDVDFSLADCSRVISLEFVDWPTDTLNYDKLDLIIDVLLSVKKAMKEGEAWHSRVVEFREKWAEKPKKNKKVLFDDI